jgi:DNA-binding NarL/FixJ family response regulator
MTDQIRVLLADDHALVRAGIRALLDKLDDVRVIAEANDGREALTLIETQQPDVIMMDVAMPGLNGLEATARIGQQFPQVRVIILSMHANEEYVLQALRAGAAGYLLKDAALAELQTALTTVMSGETYLDPALAQRVSTYEQRVGREASLLERLTPRQREILQLIAEGHTTQDIALILNISPKTVETHRAQLMERLGIYDVPGLVRYAIRSGIIVSDQ